MMNWWLFPPQTNEVQFDEKWSFVRKKEKNCDPSDPNDDNFGDSWDHVAFDPEHRLVLGVVPGKRNAENIRKIVLDCKKRTNGKIMRLITTDMYAPYIDAILEAYGALVLPSPTGKRGRPKKPYIVPIPGLTYAMIKKTLKKGGISCVRKIIVFGSNEDVEKALCKSKVSSKINTSFIERHNGSDRNRNKRKARKSYCFSKESEFHDAMTYFTMYSYNFCWPVRTLRIQMKSGDQIGRAHV